MRLASSILLISIAAVPCSAISETALRSEAGNSGAKHVKQLLKASDATDNEDRMISVINLGEAATRAGKSLIPKGEVMLGYARPENRAALVEALKQLEDGADARVSEILAYRHSKVSGADTQVFSEIHANQDPKISGKHMMEEGGVASNGARAKLTRQELAAQKKREAKKMAAKKNGWIENRLPPGRVYEPSSKETDTASFFMDSNLRILDEAIKLSNEGKQSGTTMLQVLSEGFQSGVSFARRLSAAKAKAGDGKYATSLQTQHLQGWVDSKFSVDNVFDEMWDLEKITLEDRPLAYTIVDTMKTFIGLFNDKHPESAVPTFTYLMEKFKGDHIFGFLLCLAKAKGHDVSDLQLELHREWATDMVPSDLYTYINEMLLNGKHATVEGLNVDVEAIMQQMQKDFNEFYMKEFPDGVKNHPTSAR